MPSSLRAGADCQAAGYLDGRQMATPFDVIRANDLIFSYVVLDWLMGQQPPAFDLLAWNADTSRRPAATARGGRTGPSGRPVRRRPRRAAEHGQPAVTLLWRCSR